MKIEKLRKEIGQIVTESISGLLAPSTDEEYSRVEQKIAQRLIAHISEAVLSGECADLDKSLGVVGRCKAGLGEFSPMVTWAHGIWKDGLLTAKHETTTFIAVRRAK